MFQSLRANNQIYILYKEPGQIPHLETGIVMDVTAPRPAQVNGGFINPVTTMPQMKYVVDMNVKVGESTMFLQGLAAGSTTDIPKSNPNVVVSMSREQIDEEVKSFGQRSVDIINSIPYHEDVINACDKIHQQLNPEIAKQHQTDQEILALKQQMSQMSQGMSQMMEVNKQLLEKLNNMSGTNKVSNKQKGDN